MLNYERRAMAIGCSKVLTHGKIEGESKAAMVPLVTSQVSSSAESIGTIMNLFGKGIVCIPEYQRDSDQWSDQKKSLFIDSILNNITVPSLIYAKHTPERKDECCWTDKYEVVDGQQRLTLLYNFYNNGFKLCQSKDLNFLSPNAVYYANKYFSDLPEMFKQIFENYKISIIYLPSTMTKAVKLETFRRLNQQPYTLSSQDIRLSQFSFSKVSNFIRLCGIFDPEKHGSKRMINYGKEYGIEWPWDNYQDDIKKAWYSWWRKKKSNAGQKASEMFIWYLIGLYHNDINELVHDQAHLARKLNMSFIDSIDNVADITLAQLNIEERDGISKLCTFEVLQNDIFPKFVLWFDFFYKNFPSTFNIGRYRLISFMFAALYKYHPLSLQDKHQDWLDRLLNRPRDTSTALGITYPETKGKWKSNKGLYNQIQSIHNIVDEILK